jgi:hypothetical protein
MAATVLSEEFRLLFDNVPQALWTDGSLLPL